MRDVEVATGILVGRAVIDAEKPLIHKEVDQRHADAFFGVEAVAVRGRVAVGTFKIALQFAALVERPSVGGVGIARLGVANEQCVQGERPIAFDHRAAVIGSARDEGQTGVLDVRDHAIVQKIPFRPEPDRRDIAVGTVEGGGVMVDHRHPALLESGAVAAGRRLAAIILRGLARYLDRRQRTSRLGPRPDIVRVVGIVFLV